MLQIGDDVRMKNPDLEVKDEKLSQEPLTLLKALDYIGVITKIEGNLYFVGFVHDNLGWVTQGFNEDQLEKVN